MLLSTDERCHNCVALNSQVTHSNSATLTYNYGPPRLTQVNRIGSISSSWRAKSNTKSPSHRQWQFNRATLLLTKRWFPRVLSMWRTFTCCLPFATNRTSREELSFEPTKRQRLAGENRIDQRRLRATSAEARHHCRRGLHRAYIICRAGNDERPSSRAWLKIALPTA